MAEERPKEISRYSVLCLWSATSYGAGELEYLQSIFNLAGTVLSEGSELVAVDVVGVGWSGGGGVVLLLSARAVCPRLLVGGEKWRRDAKLGARRKSAALEGPKDLRNPDKGNRFLFNSKMEIFLEPAGSSKISWVTPNENNKRV